jgi:hypothetical protein
LALRALSLSQQFGRSTETAPPARPVLGSLVYVANFSKSGVSLSIGHGDYWTADA